MKPGIAILFYLLLFYVSPAQYYLRGEIKDEKNNPLSNAKIQLHTTRYVYYSGNTGSFGIMSTRQNDSVSVFVDGFQPQCVLLDASHYQQVIMKPLYASTVLHKNGLLSFTVNMKLEDRQNKPITNETYSALLENEFTPARKFPETAFAIHTDKASYSNVRRFINMNTEVPPDAVRTEELLNYFNFDYKAPPVDSVFGFTSYFTACPWNPYNQLLFLHTCAKKLDPAKTPPSNLVFLIDVSGSMDMPNRLPLLKSAFKLLVDNLRETDTISIVVYGSTVGVWLQPTCGTEKKKIRQSIEELYPGGSTPGTSGIRSAYRLAKSQFIPGGNNRVILATDGDFNVGQTSEAELEEMIVQHRQWGIYLTCLGVGMGNYKDSKLEVLAKKGNGNFAYLDNEKEAEKVLMTELNQTLYTVADDAFLSVKFNPSLVKEYRLIGYDNKYKSITDTLSKMEGGEVGAGHSVLALFELQTVGNPQDMYGGDALAEVVVNYKQPNDSASYVTSFNCPAVLTDFVDLPTGYQFASSVALFGSLLKQSKYVNHATFTDAIILANNASSKDDMLQQEFITLVTKAKKIYARSRKNRRKASG
ncbi:MAG: von Willebrand factor type A domain-containing protein [Chitinophagaceae bacterium]